MFIRTHAVRQTFTNTGRRFLDKLAESATENRIKNSARRMLDERMAKATPHLTSPQRRVLSKRLRQNPGFDAALKDIREQIGPAVAAVQERLPEASKDGQIQGLARLLDEAHVPETFDPHHWELRQISSGRFILGDCCAFAQSESGEHGSILRFQKDWAAVFLPISPTTLLVGARDTAPPSIDVDQINRVSASLSERFVYSSSVDECVGALPQRIGSASALLSDDEHDAIVDEIWTDLDRET